MKRAALVLLACLGLTVMLHGARTLDIWVIDTEGGKALLVVSPSGRSMLIDTGFPGNDGRDTNRILEACRAAGVKKLDVLLTTHYDLDHVSNTPSVAARMPAALFVDHGRPVVSDAQTLAAVKAYDALWAGARHQVAKPGDRIPLEGVDVQVLASGGKTVERSVRGGGGTNAACSTVQRRTWPSADEDRSENSASVVTLFTFGAFRMLDTGDLTWNREMDLVCPENRIGPVDLFMVGHHGNDISNNPALIDGVRPRVAVMNNGPRKVGAASVIARLKSAPGLQALYQLHWSENAPAENPPDAFIANLRASADGNWIKIAAEENGTMVVTNGRTGESKTYAAPNARPAR